MNNDSPKYANNRTTAAATGASRPSPEAAAGASESTSASEIASASLSDGHSFQDTRRLEPQDEVCHSPSAPSRRLEIALFVFVIVVVGPWVKPLSAQPAARLAFTAAIVDRGTIYIDAYRDVTLPIDRVETEDGRLLPDKAPGQPLLAVPVYAVGRLAGAEPATVYRITENLTLWWVALWSAIVPLGLLSVLMLRRAWQVVGPVAIEATLAMVFATFLLPFGGELYGHLMAATFGFGAWLLARGPHERAGRWLGAGALAGCAVVTEYPLIIVALTVAGYLAVRGRALRPVVLYVLGAVPAALVLLGYQWAAFGAPLRTSYGAKFNEQGGSIPTSWPSPVNLGQVLVGERGLLLFAPVLLIALAGLVYLIRRAHAAGHDDAIVAAVILGAFLLLQSSWPNPWGGSGPGPRYVVPALPFLCVPLAAVWRERLFLSRALTALGAAVMLLAMATDNLVGEGQSLLRALITSARDEGISPTVYTVVLGPFGWVLYGATIGFASWWLVTSVRQARAADAVSA
jgi:hypothetical protein